MENNNLFLFCDNAIKKIHSRYPNYMRKCLYSHVDEEIIDRLYEICHILVTGETFAESTRREELDKAKKSLKKGEYKLSLPTI